MAHYLKYFKDLIEEREGEILSDFFTFLRFQSISTLKEYLPEIQNCAHWVEAYLKTIGFKTEIWETSHHPVVYAENLKAGPTKPTLLFYQHYDVQPVDPLDLWDSPPFEPTQKGDTVFARGASDNKGQAFYVFTALKLLMEKEGEFPLNIKLVVEGEEETGSQGLIGILHSHKLKLKADYLTLIDVDIPNIDTPALNLATRGIITYTLEVTGSNTDLHSGIHGGLVYNPLRALSEAFAKMYDNKGEVTIPHFYEDLIELSEDQKKELYIDFDSEEYEREYQAKANGGEHRFSPLERTGQRPTFEINGIWGGYNGPGFKTVIPAKAFAKVSIRLAANQNADKIDRSFKKHIPTLFPPGIKLSIIPESNPAGPFFCPFNSKIVKAASKAYETVFNKPCKRIMGGGSLPIASLLREISESETLEFGLGLSSDKIHAPNEHFSISRIKKGALIVIEFIKNLAHLPT
jgi:acetylornithine deacetylase/succinyl-diaminopimelate desuccinylase-like protein